ncbi:phage portal protein family protein [Acinetobacter sp. NIPH 298]|uniref:phage portal protein family protein n=1 Tax=Acinetobacter sp. NIPH 298 TaxID=1217692 RepID=UPI0002CF9107|nr:DUF935 family protein [Acinetobacter sp. NIPH 298]ENW95768.1 hypothetical protein F903_01530 [Acinetobacter sp. NIPH 298]
MAKSKKEDKASKKALSGGSLFQQNAVSMLYNLGKQPDIDEVLRKAGVSRHRLKILLDDDEIAQAVETRIDALLATPFRIEPSDTPEALLLMQELKEWFTELASGAVNALFFGYSVLEAVYEEKPEGHIGLQWIGEKPMQWFEPKNDGRLIYRPEGTGQEVVVDQKLKFFLTRRKATYEQPYGKALLATLYWLNFFKQNGFKFWAKFLERFGTPILLGKCKDSETDDMNQALLNAHAQSVLSIDSEDDVQVLTAGANGTAGASFETFNNVLIRQIQKVILGQTLTSGTDGTGSRALGQVHENVRKDKLNADVRLVTPTFQAAVNALCTLNNWPKHEVYLGEKTKQLNTDQADRDVKLKNAGANLTQQYFSREYGLQDGDVAETPQVQSVKQFKALPKSSFSFAASVKKFTPEQQEVEELTDGQKGIQLLSAKQINDLIQKSDTPEELASNLMQLMPGASDSEFAANLDMALYAADVLGYVTASGE